MRPCRRGIVPVLSALVLCVPVAACSSSGGSHAIRNRRERSQAASGNAVVPRVANTSTTTTSKVPVPLPPSMVGTQWSSLPTNEPLVALTFDCGSNDGGIPKILSALRASGATGTFTLTGAFTKAYPQDAREIAAAGYDIANHTYHHLDLTTLSPPEASAEITQAAQIIESVTGRNPSPVFRFPYGSYNSSLIQLVNSLGYGGFSWTVDTLGWEGTTPSGSGQGGQTVQSVEARALGALTLGEIILMHCGSAPDNTTLDADALPAIIRQIQARGYRFVTLHGFLRSFEQSGSVATGSSTKYWSGR